jgi:hypothetical protein
MSAKCRDSSITVIRPHAEPRLGLYLASGVSASRRPGVVGRSRTQTPDAFIRSATESTAEEIVQFPLV